MSSRCSRGLVVLVGLGVVAACASSDDAPGQDPGEGASEKYLGLDTPTKEDGFQVRSLGTTVDPGDDVEFCEVAALPGTPDQTYYTHAVELANGKGSHHLIVMAAKPGGRAEAKLQAMNIGDKVPCVSSQGTFGEDMYGVGGIQQPYARMSAPEGIAQRFYGGQRIVFDYHYYNTTGEPVEARSAVNFHVMKRENVKQLSGDFSALNWPIDTPPGQTKAFKAECLFEKEAIVGSLTRHTHRWGGDFRAWFAGGPKDGELIWTSPDFEHDVNHAFAEPVHVHAGEGFSFECSYTNGENRPLRFGTSATDEMCILAGSIWDPDGNFEPPVFTCNITWADETGLGHDTSYEGSFPPPPAADVAVCQGALGTAATDCTTCLCNACAPILIKCFTDKDCLPIVQCQEEDCTPVLDAHSSAVGMSRQVGECLSKRCSAECNGQAG